MLFVTRRNQPTGFILERVPTYLALAIALPILVTSASAQDEAWKQNFAACAGNSPFIEGLLKRHEQDHRPLMRIGEMQAWAIKDENGEPTIALTTNDGLTIIGDIIGPQGEDISAALLATMPSLEEQGTATPHAALDNAPLSPKASAPLPQSMASTPQPEAQSTMSTALSNLTRPTPPNTPENSNETAAASEPATAPITASAAPSAEAQAGMNTIFKQATEERVWFSAAQARDGAPVVYMLADPECPHCQWTIDKMHTQIVSGDIDLRIIFTPITGPAGLNTSLSILHSGDVAPTFLSHMTSKTRGTPAVAQMDTSTADRAVIQGIVDNINWMRTNRMPGVPFFLYMTDEGARFAFSELPSNIMTEAKPF